MVELKNRTREQLANKLEKRATELDNDARRLSAIGMSLTSDKLREIAIELRVISTGVRP